MNNLKQPFEPPFWWSHVLHVGSRTVVKLQYFGYSSQKYLFFGPIFFNCLNPVTIRKTYKGWLKLGFINELYWTKTVEETWYVKESTEYLSWFHFHLISTFVSFWGFLCVFLSGLSVLFFLYTFNNLCGDSILTTITVGILSEYKT